MTNRGRSGTADLDGLIPRLPVTMKKFLRITLFVAAWAAVTWIYRDKLLLIARPAAGTVPRIRQAEPTSTSARTLTPAAEGSATIDDLTVIKGIGPVYQSRLGDAGIRTFSELAAADSEKIAGAIDATESMIEDWIDQARRIAT